MYARQGALYIRRNAWVLQRAPVIAVQHGQAPRRFPASSATGGEPCAGGLKTRCRLTLLDFLCNAASGYQPNDGRMDGEVRRTRTLRRIRSTRGNRPPQEWGSTEIGASAAGRYT